MQTERNNIFSKVRRVVIKIGSAVLVSSDQGLDQKRMERLGREIASIMDGNHDVILVSSGAIVAGFAKLGLTRLKGAPLPLKQAAAAVGQSGLMWMYERTFAKQGKKVAQVLLTSEDLANRTRFLNARNTVHTLLEHGVVPIINENDTVAVDEIRFGDNDNLSGMVAHLADADLLVILSDIDGMYTADPGVDPDAKRISLVEKITAEIEQGAGDALSVVGTGGMRSKIMAAKRVGAYGVPTVIVSGMHEGALQALFEGEDIGTVFLPKADKNRSRKHWIAFTAKSRGKVVVDDGGREALVHKGKSLLPGGVAKVRGSFRAGDCISCVDSAGREFARGLTRYSAEDLDTIKGHRTSEIEKMLGRKDYDEVIHRDDLVIL